MPVYQVRKGRRKNYLAQACWRSAHLELCRLERSGMSKPAACAKKRAEKCAYGSPRSPVIGRAIPKRNDSKSFPSEQ